MDCVSNEETNPMWEITRWLGYRHRPAFVRFELRLAA